MSKVISQETFNQVVKENEDELDMSMDEAIADAVEQFQAQGVNLSNIIRDPRKADDVIRLTRELKSRSESPNGGSDDCVTQFIIAVKDQLSCKLLAAKEGAYNYLVQIIKSAESEKKIRAIQAIKELMFGYPDLMDTQGIALLLELLESESNDIIVESLRWLVVSVTKHEPTRSSLITSNIAEKLRRIIERCSGDSAVANEVCGAIQVLVQDDDVRVCLGNAHEHARSLANELLPILPSILCGFVGEPNTSCNLLSAMTLLLVRNEFCILFHEKEGLKYVLDVMVEHPNDPKIARECFMIIKCLAGSDEVKEPIINAGAGPLLVASLEKHHKNSLAAVAGCMCLAALSLRSPHNSKELAAAGMPETLVRCMTHWKQNKTIMKQGCAAIRNQTSRCPELRDEYISLQVQDVILEAQKIHQLDFEAKSVLLDLGCDVKLTEEWKGMGVQMNN